MLEWGKDPWLIQESDLSARTTGWYETIFAGVNGYRALRAASPLVPAECPGSFIAGVFDGRESAVTELVNCPDPTPLSIIIDDETVDLSRVEKGSYSRTLDMKSGCVRTECVALSSRGARVRITLERIVDLARVHRWAERITLHALSAPKRLLLCTAIDGGRRNGEGEPLNAARHFDVRVTHDLAPGIAMESVTREAGTAMVEAVKLSGVALTVLRTSVLPTRIEQVYAVAMEPNRDVVVCRFGATGTSRDGTGFLVARVFNLLEETVAQGWDTVAAGHGAAMSALWAAIDIGIEGDVRAQAALRYNLLQLALCAPAGDPSVSVGAKGLHGEGYKGHVFWDMETFMFPFFLYTRPDIARSLLLYRYRTLEGARENARGCGARGARFAWESAVDGKEATPRWGVDYAGHRVPILTGEEEVHIGADIAHAIFSYVRATGDEAFLDEQGLHLLFEIAQFWSTYATWNAAKDRYDILKVIGPDEFHEHVNNNAYTNSLVRWMLRKTLELRDRYAKEKPAVLARAEEAAGVLPKDPEAWKRVAEKLFVPENAEAGVIEQFEGYHLLKEYPITEKEKSGLPAWPKGLDVSRLGDTTLVKQPDVVMLLALLGDEFPRDLRERTYDFYDARTMHKSSLSPSMSAMVGISLGRTKAALGHFMTSLVTDLEDTQGNMALGFHSASAGGVWQATVYGFGGFSVSRDGVPTFAPWLPPAWTGLTYRLAWQGTTIAVEARQDGVKLHADAGVKAVVYGKPVVITKKESLFRK